MHPEQLGLERNYTCHASCKATVVLNVNIRESNGGPPHWLFKDILILLSLLFYYHWLLGISGISVQQGICLTKIFHQGARHHGWPCTRDISNESLSATPQ